jgi:hypothetical protein
MRQREKTARNTECKSCGKTHDSDCQTVLLVFNGYGSYETGNDADLWGVKTAWY